ncbi:MAG: hypothetical protein RRA94_02080 [Bacteroidota bacterium]|nr:hypothetical protein [Bacteroidota bacterium]
MHHFKRFSGLVMLLLLLASIAWALADSKSVNILFEAAWEADESLPGGGVIVSRGEGGNGVITVDLPMPPPAEGQSEPIELTADNVTFMDITVEDDEGVSRHYTEEHIKSINYRIEFDYEWDNGVTQAYLVQHTVAAK